MPTQVSGIFVGNFFITTGPPTAERPAARPPTEPAAAQAKATAHTAWLRGRLAADASRAHQLAAELAAALATIPTAVDGEGQAAETEPPTGWENELGELAHRLTRLATSISAAAREHQAVAADWRHAARTAGIRRSPATTAVGDETPTGAASTSDAEAPGDLVEELPPGLRRDRRVPLAHRWPVAPVPGVQRT
ncbi:hypothetical protein [Nonomuraea africana]|uniref:Uncharacterized protein YukE n=1 Tax=Nonomuraea africana TaxID=46171 RepID=A0ABR9KSB9_9ACTN|nr:hypothetical protein [Nonomuraea africana]MBE1564478.1 uncharacterized protein YukE [Nonomuraea africana]